MCILILHECRRRRMLVCMYTTSRSYLTVSMEKNGITKPRERSFKRVLLSQPHKQTELTTHFWLSCHTIQATLLQGTEVGLRNCDDISHGSFPESIQRPSLHNCRKSPNPLPEDPIASCGSASLAGRARKYCYSRCRKWYIYPALSRQPPNDPLKLDYHLLTLRGTLRPHNLCKVRRCALEPRLLPLPKQSLGNSPFNFFAPSSL